jgi:hypothetical protein
MVQLLRSIFSIFFKKWKDVIFTLLLLKKENAIYKRQLNLNKKKLQTKRAVNYLTIVKPKTLLDWQRRVIKNFWTYKHKSPGRKPVSKSTNDLIL